MALLWLPDSHPAPVGASSEAPPDPSSCTPATLTLRVHFVDGGPVDAHTLNDVILKQDAKNCEYLTAHDPARSQFSVTLSARAEAETINSGVTAAICPGRTSCSVPPSDTTSDIALVRDALHRLGYPEADVRGAEYVGESPASDIVYGVRLRTAKGCLVSFARTGQGAAPMGPVGILSDGRCLHPCSTGRCLHPCSTAIPQLRPSRPPGPGAALDHLRIEASTACNAGR
jgi:hypothetical protein